jgi:translation initiation factor IF-2
MQTENSKRIPRGPVVAVMGHIDHGKSTLLSYIRKSNKPLNEAGGITQHISAYEVSHKTESGEIKSITFLDTPGHEAFSGIRKRGAGVADIAILVVSAEDGVKPQTLEALSSIKASGIPFIVAINKIDKPGANIEKTKQSLTENEVYLEGYGGDIPVVALSAKTGDGVPELLDMIVLVSELADLSGNPDLNAEGVVLESNRDIKKGISATCIIKNGSLKKGMYIASGTASAPIRMIENYLGKQINDAAFPSPVKIIGFDELPQVGETFHTFGSREEAREFVAKEKEKLSSKSKTHDSVSELCEVIIPLVVKADTGSSLEALISEIKKQKNEKVCTEIISSGIGNISENDTRVANGSIKAVIIGFNVDVDSPAKSLAERNEIEVKTFNIIYKMSEWLAERLVERTPKVKTVESLGTAKVLKIFSKIRDKQILGGKVEKGTLSLGAQVKIMRRDAEICEGKIRELQSQKNSISSVSEGKEFGAMIEAKIEIAPGDRIENFIIIEK